MTISKNTLNSGGDKITTTMDIHLETHVKASLTKLDPS
jgi:hypothetical protein